MPRAGGAGSATRMLPPGSDDSHDSPPPPSDQGAAARRMERRSPPVERAHRAIERQWGMLTDGLLDLARVAAGDRVLDLASGTGDPALAAAVRVGPTGTVIATDISPDMLAFAAQRAAAAGLTNVEAHEMDAERIDLPDAERRRGALPARADVPARPGQRPRRRVPRAGPGRPVRRGYPVAARRHRIAARHRPCSPRWTCRNRRRPDPASRGSSPSLTPRHLRRAERAGMAEIRVAPHTVTHAYPLAAGVGRLRARAQRPAADAACRGAGGADRDGPAGGGRGDDAIPRRVTGASASRATTTTRWPPASS